MIEVLHGDCIEVMRTLDDSSIHAIVTDPPYGLGFMGKAWDDLPPGLPFALEALRVLKPGGHILAFGGTRTWHRLAVAIEDAGFEVRDSIAWLYGSGFPKSLDVGKAIDKAAGAERPIIGSRPLFGTARIIGGQGSATAGRAEEFYATKAMRDTLELTAPATKDAAQWQGWGTALKPAFEPIVVARKPLAGTVAANVLAHGTGALNIDGCRIAGSVPRTTQGVSVNQGTIYGNGINKPGVTEFEPHTAGRWPANVVLDESQAAALDEQSGSVKGAVSNGKRAGTGYEGGFAAMEQVASYGDTGGASRFFYVAKAPKRERPTVDGIAHPTVKPLSLMRYLVKLVTPPGGVLLDPFAGSGTTLEAAELEGFDAIGIEREADYLPLIAARLERAMA